MSSVTHEVKKLKNYINGEWIESASKQTEIVFNPATGEAIAEVPLSTREDFCPFYKYPKVDKEQIKNLKRWCSDAGVKISSLLPLYYWAGPDEERRQAAVRNWKRAIEVAVELDVDLMNSEFNGSKFNEVICEEKCC